MVRTIRILELKVGMGLLLLAAGNGWAQETEAPNDAAEVVDSEGMEDLEALEDLEEEMLEELRFDSFVDESAHSEYPGLRTDDLSFGVQTVVEVPAAPSLGVPTRDVVVDPPLQLEEIAPPVVPLDRFDLTGIEPVFGLDHLDHPQIQTYLHFWTTRGRSRLARLLSRSGRYADFIKGELQAAGLPPELLYLVLVESGFNTSARSRAAAVGLWQFMARTGQSHGLRVDRRVDERRDWEKATAAGIDYLGELHERFQSWPLAMAAYNAGAGHVRGELRRYNVNNFWVMDDYSAVWDDTRAYVYKIIAAAIIGEHPERFGFHGIVYEDPIRFDAVEVPGRTRLQVFARAADTDVDTLQDLNPELLVAMTPRQDVYSLRIPYGSLASFVEEYDDVDPDDFTTGVGHTVRFGERIAHVADAFGLSERVIRLANGLERREELPYGADLIIPVTESEAERALELYRPIPADGDDDELAVAIVPALQFDYPDRVLVLYEVQEDDTVADIAAAFSASPFDISMWNDVDPDAVLHMGMVIQVFVDPSADLSNVRHFSDDQFQVLALDSAEYLAWDEAEEQRRHRQRRTYTVRRGDTVGRIARRFGVRTSDIVRWNDLNSAAHIRVGQTLRVR